MSPIFDKSRNLIGIATIARDITKQKKSELALKESSEIMYLNRLKKVKQQ
jgi:hypothetical protein